MSDDKNKGEETVDFLTKMIKEDVENSVYNRPVATRFRRSLTAICTSAPPMRFTSIIPSPAGFMEHSIFGSTIRTH